MSTGAQAQPSTRDREWFLRAVLVLQRPTLVFVGLRDESEESRQARQEPVLALVWLAGIAGVLATPVARTLLGDPALDGIVVAVWAFLAGGLYGTVAYFALGALVHLAARALGGRGTYRRARHVVAFAAAPVALSLVVLWPLGLAAFGGDLFREGGADEGVGGRAFAGCAAAFAAWAVALLVVGVRSVHGWTWLRALAASALALAPVALLLLAH